MRATTPAEGGTRMRGSVKRVELPLRATPVGPGYIEHRTGDGRRVFIHRDVIADLGILERREHPDETAGLLFGRLFTDGTNPCALVRHLVWPEPGEVLGTPATVTITAEGSTGMGRRANERHPCADAVGWAHTHPTFDAYFSATDRAEQAVWTESASVGLVLSGLPDADPPYKVFVGAGAVHAERVWPAVANRRPEPRARASRLTTPTWPEEEVAAPKTAAPRSPSPSPTGIQVEQPEGTPDRAVLQPTRPRHRTGRAKRQWIVVAVLSLLAALIATLWVMADGFRGGDSRATRQPSTAPIEIYHMPMELE